METEDLAGQRTKTSYRSCLRRTFNPNGHCRSLDKHTIYDQEICEKVRRKCEPRNNREYCIDDYYWPSGAKTVVELFDGRPRRINGKLILGSKDPVGKGCMWNSSNKRFFCFKPERELNLPDGVMGATNQPSSTASKPVASLGKQSKGASKPGYCRLSRFYDQGVSQIGVCERVFDESRSRLTFKWISGGRVVLQSKNGSVYGATKIDGEEAGVTNAMGEGGETDCTLAWISDYMFCFKEAPFRDMSVHKKRLAGGASLVDSSVEASSMKHTPRPRSGRRSFRSVSADAVRTAIMDLGDNCYWVRPAVTNFYGRHYGFPKDQKFFQITPESAKASFIKEHWKWFFEPGKPRKALLLDPYREGVEEYEEFQSNIHRLQRLAKADMLTFQSQIGRLDDGTDGGRVGVEHQIQLKDAKQYHWRDDAKPRNANNAACIPVGRYASFSVKETKVKAAEKFLHFYADRGFPSELYRVVSFDYVYNWHPMYLRIQTSNGGLKLERERHGLALFRKDQTTGEWSLKRYELRNRSRPIDALIVDSWLMKER